MFCLQKEPSAASISNYPLASLQELWWLSLPAILMLFSGSLMSFCDRLFLTHDSLASLEACVNASFLSLAFQMCLMYWTGMAQVFVGQCIGAGQLQRVGSYVWQMVWLSLFSMGITLPLSSLAEYIFFRGTLIEEQGGIYFRCLMAWNFLFPLGAALSSFYLGRGKVLRILWATIAVNLLNIILDPLLIFGIPGWTPHLGILGAALATCIAQGAFCVMLFIPFLSKKNREIYGTGAFQIRKQVWWQSFKIGLPRSLTKLIIMSAWLANYRLMTLKGGDFLLVLSVTTTLNCLFSFIHDGMSKGITTIASFIIGKRDFQMIARLTRSSFFFLICSAAIIFIPCFICPRLLLSIFFLHSLNPDQVDLIVQAMHGLWVFVVVYGVNQIAFALLFSLGDTLFTMLYNLFSSWPLSHFTLMIALQLGNCSADKFYFILSIGTIVNAGVYFIRFRTKNWKSLVA